MRARFGSGIGPADGTDRALDRTADADFLFNPRVNLQNQVGIFCAAYHISPRAQRAVRLVVLCAPLRVKFHICFKNTRRLVFSFWIVVKKSGFSNEQIAQLF